MDRLLPFVVLLCLFCSCEKEPFLVLNSPDSVHFTDQGGTQQVSFTANHDWSIMSSASWFKVSPLSGLKSEGEVSLTITCDPNTTYDSRNATVTLRSEDLRRTIKVTQDSNLELSVGQLSYSFDCVAQILEVEVSANVDYAVDIDSSCQEWISQSRTKVLSSNILVFYIGANISSIAREGRINIKQTGGELSQTITIKQSAFDSSALGPYVLLTFSSKNVQPIQVLPDSARWTILWGDGQYSYWGNSAEHSFEAEGPHEVLLSGSDITEFSTSIKGLEMIDLSNF